MTHPIQPPIRVRDVMQRSVVTVLPNLNLRELITVLSRHRISGAPVVDERGATVGVVSIRDVIDYLVHQLEIPLGSLGWTVLPGEVDDDEDDAYFSLGQDDLRIAAEAEADDRLDEHSVQEIMTRAAFSVSPEDEVAEAARFMVQGRIHRALVVDDEELVGIVSPLDLLQALVNERGAALSPA